MTDQYEPTTVWTGHHLTVATRGGWEYVRRNTMKPAVAVVAVTQERNIVLVEQYRPSVHHHVIELPAGLAGDRAGAEHELLVEAAKRELWEETGYAASRWRELASCYTSPGLADESIVLYLAEGLEKRGPGGGDESESIIIHEVPLEGIFTWLAGHGGHVDLKLLAGLGVAQRYLAVKEE